MRILNVRLLWETNRYDVVLSGYGVTDDGQMVYVDVDDGWPDNENPTYTAWPLTGEEAAAEIGRHSDWERLVGFNCCWHPIGSDAPRMQPNYRPDGLEQFYRLNPLRHATDVPYNRHREPLGPCDPYAHPGRRQR